MSVLVEDGRPIVAFLCTANACRSQMGEALCRSKWPHLRAVSAGVRPGLQVDPHCITVLQELGIDMSGARNKSVTELEVLCGGQAPALVVTVCDNAASECPSYPGARNQVHMPFPDPPALARAAPGTDPLVLYREVRDEIAAFVGTLPSLAPELAAPAFVAAAAVTAASVSGDVAAPAVLASTAAEAPAAVAAADGGASSSADTEASPVAPASCVGPPQQDLKSSEATPAVVCEVTASILRDPAVGGVGAAAAAEVAADPGAISAFERYLTLWVLVCMVVGGLIGYYAPGVADALSKADFMHINGVVSALLWLMLFPMLVQIDFAAIKRVREAPGAVVLTSVVNYAIQPFTMYAIALLFFRVLYVDAIPDAGLRDSYIAGCILLAGAPCTAMVFVWSLLVGGDPGYTLVQVAFNDLLLLALYVPTAGLLLGVSNIPLPWDVIAIAVALFIVAPLVVAAAVRTLVLRTHGEAFLRDRVIAPFKPVTTVALLLTLVLVFIFQGRTIGEKPLHIVLLVVPMVLQTVIIFGVTYAAGYLTCMDHKRVAPASMIATSNFFELAVAVAIALYGLDSGAALATVVGVLVEVPVMLFLVYICKKLRPALERRIAVCDEVCPWVKTAGSQLASPCGSRKACCGGSSTSLPVVAPERDAGGAAAGCKS